MILVHDKGASDPHGIQQIIMRLLAANPKPVQQSTIEDHVLQTCAAHAISHLEYLGNSGAIGKPNGATHTFALTPAGREWCRERAIKVRAFASPDQIEDETTDGDTSDAPEQPKPRKRGRPAASKPVG
jgi:predicted transcriptional regulator